MKSFNCNELWCKHCHTWNSLDDERNSYDRPSPSGKIINGEDNCAIMDHVTGCVENCNADLWEPVWYLFSLNAEKARLEITNSKF